MQDSVIDGLLLHGVLGLRLNGLDSRGRELLSGDADNLIEHLILEALLRHSEIKHGEFDADFGAVVRSWHFSGHEELELFAIGDHLVTEFDEHLTALLLNLFGKNRVEHGIKALSCIFKDDWVTHVNAGLKCA